MNAAKLTAPKPHFAPIMRRSLAQDALTHIRRAIVGNERPSGTGERLVEVDNRGRSRVRNFSDEDFEDVYSMRCALEMMSARLAVQRITDADIHDLEAIIRQQESAADLTELSVQDVAMHERIIQVTRHRQLMVCWKTIRSQIEVWLARAHRAQAATHLSAVEFTVPGHRGLLAALCSAQGRRGHENGNDHLARVVAGGASERSGRAIPMYLRVAIALLTCVSFQARSAETNGSAWFETKIRSLLVNRCYECHNEKKHKGDLRLDSKAAWQKWRGERRRN